MTSPELPLDASDDAFGRFTVLVGRHLDLDLTTAGPGSLLRDDLGFDSLAMAELVVLLAEWDVHLPDELVPALRTLGDVHHYASVLAPLPPTLVPARAAGDALPAFTVGGAR